MTRHIKADVRVASRNDVATEFLDDGIQIWSSGAPCEQIQMKVGELLLVADARSLIDAVQRCSDVR